MKGSLSDLVTDGTVTPTWIRQSSRFWYLKKTPAAKEFLLVDGERNTRAPLFDHEKLAGALSATAGKIYTATALPFDTLNYSTTAGRSSSTRATPASIATSPHIAARTVAPQPRRGQAWGDAEAAAVAVRMSHGIPPVPPTASSLPS